MQFHEKLYTLRRQANLTQTDLAEKLDVSRQAVSKWENGQTSPDTVKLIQLADVLNTEVEFLATGRTPAYEQPPIVVNMVKTEEKIVEVEKVIEKPVIKKVTRVKYLRNPLEFIAVGGLGFLAGVLLGLLL